MASITQGIIQAQERQTQCNKVLNLLNKEQRQTDNAINNIMNAIEQGGSTATAMKRLRELECKQEDLKRQILIEKSKTAVQLADNQIIEFYEKALRLKPQMLIEYLIKEIILFDDKIQIQFNTPINGSPDESLGFIFRKKTVSLAYNVPFRTNLLKYEFEIDLFV